MELRGIESKIMSATAKLEKIQKTIAKREAYVKRLEEKASKMGIDMEKPNMFDSEVYEVVCKIRINKDDLGRNYFDRDQYTGYLKKLNAKEKELLEKNKAIDVIRVPAVEKFLADWGQAVLDNMKEEIAEVNKYLEAGHSVYEAAKIYSPMAIANFDREEDELQRRVDRDIQDKRYDLYVRCAKVVGVITDARGLKLGDNGSINGGIIGEDGMANVETIWAGGYNIQRLHFRVLVKKA